MTFCAGCIYPVVEANGSYYCHIQGKVISKYKVRITTCRSGKPLQNIVKEMKNENINVQGLHKEVSD